MSINNYIKPVCKCKSDTDYCKSCHSMCELCFDIYHNKSFKLKNCICGQLLCKTCLTDEEHLCRKKL